MISTGTLMLGKSLLTAGVALGFCFSQLRALKRMKQEDEEKRRADAAAGPESDPGAPRSNKSPNNT